MPTLPMKAPVHHASDNYEEAIERTLFGGELGMDLGLVVRNTAPFNLTGHPAISIPCGKVDGLPIGLMLVAPYFREDLLLQIAAAYQHAVDWDSFLSPFGSIRISYMGRIIDADSHFMEPLDIWQRYIEPRYRERCLRFVPRPDNDRYMILIEENTRARFNVEDFLGVLIGYGQKELGTGLGSFDLSEIFNHALEDMQATHSVS